MVLLDSVALQEAHQPGGGSVRAHRPSIRLGATPAARQQPARQALARPPPGPRRHPVEAAHRPTVARCPETVRAVADDLPQPATPLAAGRDLAQDLDGAGSRRPRLTQRPPRPDQQGDAGGGANDSTGRGPDGGDATTTTTAPAACWAATTTPARTAAGAPRRSRSPPGPTLATLAVVAVLRAQLPPAPTRAAPAAWARTAARNAWATSTRVTCRYQAS
jgi:hypothetical protein